MIAPPPRLRPSRPPCPSTTGIHAPPRAARKRTPEDHSARPGGAGQAPGADGDHVTQSINRPEIQSALQQIVEQRLHRAPLRRTSLRAAHRAVTPFQTIIRFRGRGRKTYRIEPARATTNVVMGFATGGNAQQYGIGGTGTSATRQPSASALMVAVDRVYRMMNARRRSVPSSDAVHPARRGAIVVPSPQIPDYRSALNRVQRRSEPNPRTLTAECVSRFSSASPV